jgi:hypothetical protein
MAQLRTAQPRTARWGTTLRERLVLAPRWLRLLPFALVTVLLAASAALAVGRMNDRLSAPPQDVRAADRFTHTYATDRHTNAELGYTYNHPPDWKVTDDGGLSTATNSNGEVIVSFGMGADGRLRAGADGLVTLVGQTYRGVELTGGQVKRIGAHLASVRRGRATTASGVRLRFVAVTVDGEQSNYAIVAFRAGGEASVERRQTIEEVIYSFRPPSDPTG